MNTRIGTSFGLAMLMVIGAVAVMFAMGILTPQPASAALGSMDVAVTPTTAKATGQYTITATQGSNVSTSTVLLKSNTPEPFTPKPHAG